MEKEVTVRAWYDQRKKKVAKLDLRLEAGPDLPVQYVDVCVTHPLTSDGCPAVPQADCITGAAAEKLAKRKHDRYPPLPNTPPLCAFAMETFGAWSREAERLFGQAAHRAGALAGGNDERRKRCQGGWVALWRTRLHCTLQQANASVLLAAASPEILPDRTDTGPFGTADWETAAGAEYFTVG